MNSEKELMILKEVVKKLNGKCDQSFRSCPMHIEKILFHLYSNQVEWGCDKCRDAISNMVNKFDCPCSVLPFETIDAIISERIEEIKNGKEISTAERA